MQELWQSVRELGDGLNVSIGTHNSDVPIQRY